MAVRNHRLAALAFFLFMAVVHSWPLASDLAHLSRLDSDDAALDIWAISWVAHELPRHPTDLFEAPAFYPEHHTLAYSEHMFVPAMMGAPMLWAGVSPVLVYNLLIIAGLALSGWSMYLLMHRWTGSQWAGIVAGLLYAFNAHVLTRFAHLQAQHVEFFPMVLYALDRVLVAPSTALGAGRRRKDAVLLAVAFALQALCSNYLLVFTLYAMAAAALVRWRELRNVETMEQLAIAGAIAAVVLAPFLWPYYEVARDQGLARSVNDVARYSGEWKDYLVTGARLHYQLWSKKFFEGRTALFPGFTAVALALVAIGHAQMRRDRRVRMMIAIVIVGVALSFGINLPGYPLLHKSLPLLNGIRNVVRWGWLALAGIAVLAGFGVAAAQQRWRNAGYVLPIVLCVLVTAESIRTPVSYTHFDGIPKIYDRFAGDDSVVIAEFPFFAGANFNLNGPYMLANTRYFKPMVNGYSSFQPASFEERGRALNSFPSELALAQLKVLKVTHVLVHTEAFRRRYRDAALKAIDTIPDLELIAEEDGIKLYRLK